MGNTQCFRDNRNRKDSEDDGSTATNIYTESGGDKVMKELEEEREASKVCSKVRFARQSDKVAHAAV